MSRVSKQLWSLLILGCIGAPLHAEEAANPDEAAVRAAAVAFLSGISAGDSDAALKHFAGDEAERKLVITYAKMPPRIEAMKKALEAKFGADAAKSKAGDDFNIAQQVVQSRTGQVTITGNTATLRTRGDAMLTLIKAGDAWKVTSLTGDAELSGVMNEFITVLGGIMETTTADINAGKYATLAEAERAAQGQTLAALQRFGPRLMAVARRKSTTAPTSQPAGKPLPTPVPQQPAE